MTRTGSLLIQIKLHRPGPVASTQTRPADALSMGSINDCAENGFVR